MIASGFLAHLVTIDPRKLDRGFAGRRFDRDLLAALPAGVDPCGENGEFHTFVSAGPMFSRQLTSWLAKSLNAMVSFFTDIVPAVGPVAQKRSG
jgi:diphthamide synthase (EF-2-diphthine--ammonia ligase)